MTIERRRTRTRWPRTASSPVLARIPAKTQGSLLRMFADPHLLEKEERAELVQGLRECVLAHPEVSELRVLYGMALCVDFKVQDAIEELREGVRLAPDSFIAQLKMGELWMRLRVIEKAEEHTHQAALLARNMMQSELARRQAATIRTLMHNGIKRGVYQLQGPVAPGNGTAQALEAGPGGRRCLGCGGCAMTSRPAILDAAGPASIQDVSFDCEPERTPWTAT